MVFIQLKEKMSDRLPFAVFFFQTLDNVNCCNIPIKYFAFSGRDMMNLMKIRAREREDSGYL